MLFVRLRAMSKKEREAWSRSCVKIMNKKNVYLTEFASETDYLRLQCLRWRQFCFDTAFPNTLHSKMSTTPHREFELLPLICTFCISDDNEFAKIGQRSYDGNWSISYLEVYNRSHILRAVYIPWLASWRR